jgi:hypothetical protein
MMLFARHHKLHRYNIVLFSVSVFILVLLIVFYLYACCVKNKAKLSFPETANNDKINKPLPLMVATRECIGRKGSIIASLSLPFLCYCPREVDLFSHKINSPLQVLQFGAHLLQWEWRTKQITPRLVCGLSLGSFIISSDFERWKFITHPHRIVAKGT